MQIAAADLRTFIARIFVRAGCTGAEAGDVARYLVEANLTGHDSHGVIRTPRYVEALRDGRVLAGRAITVVAEADGFAVVDGNFGLGQTVAPASARPGIAKAKAAGVCLVALRNSGHLGRAGDFAEMAAAEGLVSVHFVNVKGSQLVAPFGSFERRISTAPFACGVPMPDGPPLILDFATSVVAEGKVLVAQNGGKPVPEGALIGADGRTGTDPLLLYGTVEPGRSPDPRKGAGAIRAFGEHKGSGLALMCELLAGALTGNGTCGPGDTDRITNGMLSVYVSPAALDTEHGFAAEAKRYADWVRSARPATPDGEILLPGDPERRSKAKRLADGVPLPDAAWAALTDCARGLGLNDAEIPAA